MKHMKKLFALTLTLALTLSFTGCSASSEAPETKTSETEGMAALPTVDPSGAPITVPENIETIAVLSPTLAQEVIALGFGDKIVAHDLQSVGLSGLPECDVVVDFMQPDMEQLAALNPDVLFVSAMTLYDQEAPYQSLIDQGVCVICVPTSESIAAIKNDLTFMAAALGVSEKGGELITAMQTEIDKIAAIGETITDKKTVYFEISPAPYMYSFGNGVFLNEMIELIGAANVLADQTGWLPVEAETIVAANPDVILTNVNYTENPTEEIMTREGWADMTAVVNKNVFYIDNMASSSANQNIVTAMKQMAEAIYPEHYVK